jgi:hypothetical protein
MQSAANLFEEYTNSNQHYLLYSNTNPTPKNDHDEKTLKNQKQEKIKTEDKIMHDENPLKRKKSTHCVSLDTFDNKKKENVLLKKKRRKMDTECTSSTNIQYTNGNNSMQSLCDYCKEGIDPVLWDTMDISFLTNEFFVIPDVYVNLW